MLDITLTRGEHRRYWLVEIRDPATGEGVTLPPTQDWHEAVHMLNELARIYGQANVDLYQWDVTCVAMDAPQQT